MKVLAAGLAIAAMLGIVSAAHAQSDRSNLPFLKPQNGAQVQVPSGWPPGSGDVYARPPSTNYVGPGGGYAPFQGNSVGDRGMDRGIVGQPDAGAARTDTADPLTGTPRYPLRNRPPGSGDGKNGQPEADQDVRSQSNIATPRNLPPEEEVLPRVIRLPKDPQERSNVVFDLFRKTREVKPPTQAAVPVSIGSRLPVAWVYRDVPDTVTRALPSYVGYVYTNVDGRYVVLDPATYRVIAVYSANRS